MEVSADKSSTAGLDKVTLYKGADGTEHQVGIPLTSHANIREMMSDLGLPPYIDTTYLPMRTAIVAIWASQRADELSNLYPQAFEKSIAKESIPTLLFGGAAIKVLCAHSNGQARLSRNINDVDFIVPKKYGSNFYKLLLAMNHAFGTEFTFFRTKGDRTFNTVSEGRRYRIRTISSVAENGIPSAGLSDIFCDYVDLCHRVEVKNSFEHPTENLHTIGLENLILTKCQFIMEIARNEIGILEERGQSFRLLPYSYYRPDMAVIGLEEKDAKDVCAVFLDHRVGEETNEINSFKMRDRLRKDKKLALTVTLNLQNLINRADYLKQWLDEGDVSTVLGRLGELVNCLPKINKKWSKPWWNTDVETPSIT